MTVLEHEFGHGFGFQTFASSASGAFLLGVTDAFAHFLADNVTGKTWEQMATDAERKASAINTRRLVWTGPAVTAAIPSTLSGTPTLKVTAPAGIAGNYAVGTASFGNPITASGVSGDVVVGVDAADAATGSTTTDACSAITNNVAGKIAVVDRGVCGFIVKAANLQAAGAIAMIVADNAPGSPPAGISGVDPTLTIPSVRITQVDGSTIKAAIASSTVSASLFLDASVRAGADAAGRALMYAPNPLVPGSSVSHFDTSAFPNLLMEPNINADLTHGLDLTERLLRDIGWYPDADLDFVADDAGEACLGSDLRGTVEIEDCDSGVTNWFFDGGSFSGCTVADLVDRCVAGATGHGGYASCVSRTLNDLKKAGVISGSDKDAIQSCAGSAQVR